MTWWTNFRKSFVFLPFFLNPPLPSRLAPALAPCFPSLFLSQTLSDQTRLSLSNLTLTLPYLLLLPLLLLRWSNLVVENEVAASPLMAGEWIARGSGPWKERAQALQLRIRDRFRVAVDRHRHWRAESDYSPALQRWALRLRSLWRDPSSLASSPSSSSYSSSASFRFYRKRGWFLFSRNAFHWFGNCLV